MLFSAVILNSPSWTRERVVVHFDEEMERTYELLRRSNERIRISLELLAHDVPGLRQEPTPICKRCNTGMKWSRSALAEATRQIVHVFVCSLCGEIARIETRARTRLEQ